MKKEHNERYLFLKGGLGMLKVFLWIYLMSVLLQGKELPSNALADSESPYLLQHIHNPVHWMPYTDRAFKKAQKEDKLIFLSIGYSTCHWCHVMAEESFEDLRMAKLLNRDYVSIKVDKEEMPQIDTHYQHIHALLQKGRNGWPLTIILTPKGEVVYIARYVPAEDKYGIEGLYKLLPRLAQSYHDDRLRPLIAENKKKIAQTSKPIMVDNNKSVIAQYMKKMQKRYDKVFPGFDKRPRFPLASHLNFLLDIYLLDGDKEAYKMVRETLDTMAMGGIYDQVEGGFYRYSTHPDWIVPHFEKMLYTQAEMIPLYVKMYQLTHKPRYKRVVDETIKETQRILGSGGLFYAATDADSEGREGGYFIYQYDEVKSALQKAGFSEKEIEENLDYFDILDMGNFEDGFSNPQFNTGIDEVPTRMQETRQILKVLRAPKKFPFIDKKIITAWNAMMIKALFVASRIDKRYLSMAQHSLETLLQKMYHDKKLHHKFLSPRPATQAALLEDYAFLIDALLEGYEHTYEKRYVSLAKVLTKEAIEKFYKGGVWYLDEAHFAIAQYKDKYYTAPLAKLYHDMLSLASLEYDLSFLEKVKGFLKAEKSRILAAVDRSPEASRALVRSERENVVLKSTQENLVKYKEQIDKIIYPFFLTKAEKEKMFLLCNESSCFFYDKNVSKVIEKMLKGR